MEKKKDKYTLLIFKTEIKFEQDLGVYLKNSGLEEILMKDGKFLNNEMYVGKIPLIFQNNASNILMKLKKSQDYLEIKIFKKENYVECNLQKIGNENKFKEHIKALIHNIFSYEEKNI